MIEIRFHGRGGQGAVTSAELMAQTAIANEKFAQAFPSFGPERRGAPVTAFLRISETPIRIREKVYSPNVVVVLDSTVMSVTKVDDGLADDGILIVNTTASGDEIKKQYNIKQQVVTVDALHIALEILKVPITNTVMLGALAKAVKAINITPENVKEPLEARFGSVLASRNQKAFERAYNETKLEA